MKNVGLPQISNVRIGKHIELEVIASDEKKASDIVRDACKNTRQRNYGVFRI